MWLKNKGNIVKENNRHFLDFPNWQIIWNKNVLLMGLLLRVMGVVSCSIYPTEICLPQLLHILYSLWLDDMDAYWWQSTSLLSPVPNLNIKADSIIKIYTSFEEGCCEAGNQYFLHISVLHLLRKTSSGLKLELTKLDF